MKLSTTTPNQGAYTVDQREFAKAIDQTVEMYAMLEAAKQVPAGAGQAMAAAAIQVMERYAVACLPEELWPGFMILCGCPDDELDVQLTRMRSQREVLTKYGTLSPLELLNRGFEPKDQYTH
jgi:hypothetical protein